MTPLESIGAFWRAILAAWNLYREGRSIQDLHQELVDLQANLAASQKSEALLQQQVADGNQRIAELQSELRSWQAFMPIRGVLFRKLPDGNFEEAVYCPCCKVPMFAQEDQHLPGGKRFSFRFLCRCGFRSILTRSEARGILSRLRE